MPAAKATVLIVDDDPALMKMLSSALTQEGYAVRKAGGAEKAFAALSGDAVDLMMLDLQLPGVSGLSILEMLKKDPRTASLPVIMMTVKGSESDKVAGLTTGADDYLVKPFSVKEMLARVDAVLRRVRYSGRIDRRFEVAGLRLDLDSREASVGNKNVALTALEFDLLVRLIRHRGQMLTYQVLAEAMSEDFRLMTSGNLHTHVKNLRKKLGPAGEYIRTVHGLGFKFSPDND
ncbi:MAG: response regulator transcription factor [Proteobacteria bacterium]|nr:response regulator transcription factor [Pseudomonadota bacterium]